MITFEKYREFLTELSDQGVHSVRVDQLAERESVPSLLVIKHDVESDIPQAMVLARIEAQCGHFTTYYFQGDLLLQKEAADIVREISELGHEVAYHYDVLDACDGDYVKAAEEFDRYKSLIEEYSGQNLRTVCPHGNPTKVRKGWRSNKDFFRADEIRQRYPDIMDIVVDFAELMPKGTYLSDAGFKLRRISDISGNDVSNESAIADGIAVDWSDVGRLAAETNGVLLSVHSHRLRRKQISLVFMRMRMDILRAGYRLAKNIPFVKAIASKYYASTRRF